MQKVMQIQDGSCTMCTILLFLLLLLGVYFLFVSLTLFQPSPRLYQVLYTYSLMDPVGIRQGDVHQMALYQLPYTNWLQKLAIQDLTKAQTGMKRHH